MPLLMKILSLKQNERLIEFIDTEIDDAFIACLYKKWKFQSP